MISKERIYTTDIFYHGDINQYIMGYRISENIMRVSRTYHQHIWYEVRFVSPKKKRRTPGFLEVSKESSPPAAVSSSPLRSNAKSESGWCWRHPVKWYYIELYIFYIYYIQWSNRNIYSNRTNNIRNHHLWKILADSQRIFADEWLMLLWLVLCFLLLAY